MSTWYEDNREIIKKRPYYGRANWELRNMVKALESLPLLNTEEEDKRLEEVREELRLRKLID
jgi:hypothetical protein